MAKDKKKLAGQVGQATSTLEDYPPGLLPDGQLNIVQADDPPFEPEIVEDDEDAGEE